MHDFAKRHPTHCGELSEHLEYIPTNSDLLAHYITNKTESMQKELTATKELFSENVKKVMCEPNFDVAKELIMLSYTILNLGYRASLIDMAKKPSFQNQSK